MRSSSSTPQANLGEVQLGKLAQEKGGDPRVRQFGERMAGDHGQAAKEIQQLAAEKGVSVSSDISSADLRLRDRLAKLQPAAFDREYVKEMVKDHKQDVAEFREMSEKAQDPTLKAWVGKTLPTLEDHLKMIQTSTPASPPSANGRRAGLRRFCAACPGLSSR